MEESTYKFTIYLMKEEIKEFRNCIKAEKKVQYIKIRPETGIDGVIVYSETISTKPAWLFFLQSFCKEEILMENNTSNKAVMLVRIKDRIMALVFGYGKSFLRDECIVRNFGFFSALNMMDEHKIKSVHAATIEDMIVSMQKQSSRATGQEEFSLNHINDVMTSITGKGKNENWARTVSGKDSLVVTVEMFSSEIAEKLENYLAAYESTQYMENFAWVDNIREIRDRQTISELDQTLYEDIKQKRYDNLYLTPPDTIEWDDVKGFMITGEGKHKSDVINYSFEIKFEEYLDMFEDKNQNLGQKLRRDKLIMLDKDDMINTISNVYSALVAQVKLNDGLYILYSGQWYKIKKLFCDKVMNFIATIPETKIELISSVKGEAEGEYNSRVCKHQDFCLMDKKMVGVENGTRKIEACDIFTRDKQFIHVKKRDSSAQLSHLFSQGKVSIDCFISDEECRKQVYDIVKGKLGTEIFDYTKKPEIGEFEVVFAIIAEKKCLALDKLPFFSLVNLMMSIEELNKMHIKVSVKMILQE